MSTSTLHVVPNERPFNRKIDGSCARFGKLVADARAAAHLTQGELAAILKVSRSHLNAIERGRVNLDLALAVRLAQRLGIGETLGDLGDGRSARNVRLAKAGVR